MHYKYGSVEPIIFQLIKDNVGVDVTPAAGDVRFTNDYGATVTDVIAQCTAMDSVNLPGAFIFTPTTLQTQCKQFMLFIKDVSGGALFTENKLILRTGGHSLAYFNASS